MKTFLCLDHLRYEVRILGPVLFLVPLALAAFFVGLTVMLFIGNVVHGFIASLLIAALEACLPLAAGIILSTVAVQDASLELLLTMPTAYRWIAFLRFALILGWTLLVELLAALALYAFLPWVPVKPLVAGQLAWLAPSLWLAGKELQPARMVFQRQRDFIANVSHELGTPLALLRANAEVLLRGRAHMAEEDAALLEDIVAETTYMDTMTSNMLLLARMDAGQLHLEREALNLALVAESVVRHAQALASQAQITLIFQQEEAAYALGDRVLLEQAVLILLDNALKYTPPGGRVSVYIFMEKGRACLRVSDTGIGIAPADLPRLGERFYCVDKARSRETGGMAWASLSRVELSRHTRAS